MSLCKFPEITSSSSTVAISLKISLTMAMAGQYSPVNNLLQRQVVELQELIQAIGAVEGVVGWSEHGDIVGLADPILEIRQVDSLREILQLRVRFEGFVQIGVTLN